MAGKAVVRVLGINASPRRYGSSYKLLRVALEFAAREGAETRLIHLYDYRIKPCLGCVSDDILACRFPCVIRDDDFNKLGEEILSADALVLATPVYWYGVSGQLKNLIDRMTSFENMIYHTGRSLLEGKVAGIIAVGNDTGAMNVIAWLMAVLNSMGVHIPPWSMAYYEAPGEVLENKQSVLDAANIGRIVVKAVKLMKEAGAWYDPGLEKPAEDYAKKLLEELKPLQESERRERARLWEKNAESRGAP